MESNKGLFGLGRNDRGGWLMPVADFHGTKFERCTTCLSFQVLTGSILHCTEGQRIETCPKLNGGNNMIPTICLGCKEYAAKTCDGMDDATIQQCVDYTPKEKEAGR